MKIFPLLDFGLGETANLLRDSVRDFVNAEIVPLAADIDRNDHFPPELWRKMGAMGLLGITVADQYGGAEMGYLEHVIAMEKMHQGITAFLIEKTMPGFSTSPKLDKLGMRGSPTCELVFNNCSVPAENILGKLDRGVEVLMSGLNYERLVLTGGPLGIMSACMDVVLPYIHQRRQFSRAIGEFELMQGKIADMYATWNACKSYTYTVAKAADGGGNIRKDAAAVILYAAERATWMALEAIQCLGGNGYINDYPTGRLLRDAKLYEIGAGTSEIRRMLIGRELFRDTED